MALSEEEKKRIREEEQFRLEVREQLSRERERGENLGQDGSTARLKAVVFWIVLIAAAVLLFTVVRTHR